jgi:hypothetical protein
MSFRHFLHKYFSNNQETRDQHWDPALKTNYYKIKKEEGFNFLKEVVNHSPEYKLNAISEEHGEMSFHTKKGKKTFIVATVIMVRPFRTAIDFAVTSEGVLPFDFGHSRRVIIHLYERLNKEFTLAE